MTTGTTSGTKNPNEVGELKDAELEKVVGGTEAGKPTPGSFTFSHYYDKSSPNIML
jgi:type VI protein secretion system component Hcp